MRKLLLIVALMAAAGSAKADLEKHLEFPSPNNLWKVTADWYEDNGYIFELDDLSSGKVYFRTSKEAANEGMQPHRFSATWSPDGKYVAINLYYGRIAQGVGIIDVSGKVPTYHVLHELVPNEPALKNIIVGAGPWLNNTDLAASATLPFNWVHKPGDDKEFTFVIRFENHQGKIIQRSASHD